MSNVFVEGFATYGLGTFNTPSTDSRAQAMLAGRYAALGPNGGTFKLGTLPWASADTDLYLNSAGFTDNYQFEGARTVLPVASNTVVASFYGALDSLPTIAAASFLVFSDGSNNPLIGIGVSTTGAIFGYRMNYQTHGPTPPAFEIIAESSGPVLTAQNAAHIEVKLVCGTSGSNTLEVQVNGTTVINATGLAMSWDPTQTFPHPNSNACAQVTILSDITTLGATATGPTTYIGNLILRDGNGSVNNDIVGDRRVATLFVNGDDATHQGWTGQPIRRFGAGVLSLSANAAGGNDDSAVVAHPSSQLDIAAQQFTIEGNFRFQGVPSSSNKAVLYSHWDEAANHRECELYVGGPSLEGGNIVFRVSTDGTGGTITEVISWPAQFVVGHWYHVAVARDGSNKTRLFINGVIQGPAATDSHSYYAGGSSGAYAAIGADTNAGAGVGNTGFDGWQDEFRLTIGACRYTANFSPPVAAFPRGGGDASWADVVWISGWDSGTLLDESSFARTLSADDGALATLPNDGDFNFETMNKSAPPLDDSFIEAALLAASQILTYTANATANATVTVGTKDGSTAAVYTWKSSLTGSSFQVLVGASLAASLSNLAAAINAGAGAGTVYGTGTTANHDVGAAVLGATELTATALTAGAAGNSIACSSTDSNGTWGSTTLAGGQDIPGYSQFTYSRLPSNATIVDSITLLSRSWKTDAGVCTVKTSFVGSGGGVAAGANLAVTTAPTFHTDVIEADPDTSGAITPTTVTGGKIKVDRTS